MRGIRKRCLSSRDFDNSLVMQRNAGSNLLKEIFSAAPCLKNGCNPAVMHRPSTLSGSTSSVVKKVIWDFHEISPTSVSFLPERRKPAEIRYFHLNLTYLNLGKHHARIFILPKRKLDASAINLSRSEINHARYIEKISQCKIILTHLERKIFCNYGNRYTIFKGFFFKALYNFSQIANNYVQ